MFTFIQFLLVFWIVCTLLASFEDETSDPYDETYYNNSTDNE